MLLSIDGTFLIQILNLIVFWVLLNYLFIGPVQRAILARRRHIDEQYKEGDAALARAKALEAQAEAIYADARRSTDELMRDAASRASDESHAIETTATQESDAIVKTAQATVASERAKATAAQGPFVQELARSMVAKAVGNAA